MRNGWRWAVLVLGVSFLCCGSLPVVAGPAEARVFGLVFVSVGGLFVALGGAGLLAQRAFVVAELTSMGPVALGGSAEVVLSLTPRKPLVINAASKLVVTCTEEALYGAGTSQRTYQDTLYEHSQPLHLPVNLSAPWVQKFVVPIPAHVAPTWAGSSNSFFTTVTVHVDIEKWPDLKLETRVQVLPELAS